MKKWKLIVKILVITAPKGAQKEKNMGVCISCGRETANSYDYYSGDYHSQGDTYRMGSMQHTTHKYINVNRHKDFLCSKCTNPHGEIGIFIFAGIFYLVTIFLILSPFILPDKGTPPIWFTIVCFAFSSLILILGLWIKRTNDRDEKDDKAVKEEYGSNLLIDIAKKANPQKCYFTTSQYREMYKPRI